MNSCCAQFVVSPKSQLLTEYIEMRVNIQTLTLILLASTFFVSCDDEKDIDKGTPNKIDGYTRATPNGGELKAAGEGPGNSALGIPSIDLSNYSLEVTGLVESPFSLTWEEINTLPVTYTDTMLMYCVEGWEVWGIWKGIRVNDLLEMSQIIYEADYVFFSSIDGYSTTLPISYLEKYKAILAYEVNGKPLSTGNGYPLRLIAFGKFGYKWIKWVNKMEVKEESALGFWEKRGYSDQADVPLKRRVFYEGESAEALVYLPIF